MGLLRAGRHARWLDASSLAALCLSARRLGADRIAMLFAARAGEHQALEATGLPELRLAGLAAQRRRPAGDRFATTRTRAFARRRPSASGFHPESASFTAPDRGASIGRCCWAGRQSFSASIACSMRRRGAKAGRYSCLVTRAAARARCSPTRASARQGCACSPRTGWSPRRSFPLPGCPSCCLLCSVSSKRFRCRNGQRWRGLWRWVRHPLGTVSRPTSPR